jgi:periplasmic copper chaperone A
MHSPSPAMRPLGLMAPASGRSRRDIAAAVVRPLDPAQRPSRRPRWVAALMTPRVIRFHAVSAALAASAALATWAGPALAHDFRLGPLRIDHPYATPTPPGASTGAAYLRGIRNTGEQADRLIGASTPAARAVEIHRSVVDAQNVMRMRAIDGIDLPPKGEVRLRHGGEHHLMLIGLQQPLNNGDRFPMTLRFEKAGEREVTVWVQRPRDAAGAHEHKH